MVVDWDAPVACAVLCSLNTANVCYFSCYHFPHFLSCLLPLYELYSTYLMQITHSTFFNLQALVIPLPMPQTLKQKSLRLLMVIPFQLYPVTQHLVSSVIYLLLFPSSTPTNLITQAFSGTVNITANISILGYWAALQCSTKTFTLLNIFSKC